MRLWENAHQGPVGDSRHTLLRGTDLYWCSVNSGSAAAIAILNPLVSREVSIGMLEIAEDPLKTETQAARLLDQRNNHMVRPLQSTRQTREPVARLLPLFASTHRLR
jgi:hypothetical protein